MSGGIYLIQDDDKLVEMREEQYDSEELLSILLERYPSLLAGDQINPGAPRKWLLVKREMGVPAEEGAANQWSLDHLFLDQDGIPTLVEVKRSSDTRIRREVVGQMLDYAANGVAYWPVEAIKAQFETNCQNQELDPEQALRDFLGEGADTGQFWEGVKTNLQAGKVRLVFVADQIPGELRRIVEFLNEQMKFAEVLAVGIKQYAGEGLRTLVPTVVGQTTKLGTPQVRKPPLTPEEFFERIRKIDSGFPDLAERIMADVGAQGCLIDWSVTGFAAKLPDPGGSRQKLSLFYVAADARVWLWYLTGQLRSLGLAEEIAFDYARESGLLFGRQADPKYPGSWTTGVPLNELQPKYDAFMSLVQHTIDRIRQASAAKAAESPAAEA